MPIVIKRVYDPPRPEDGFRVLVDRLWPRGLAKERAKIDAWFKECAPSTELRRWFDHDPAKWDLFQERYFKELDETPHGEVLADLRTKAADQTVTLVYAAKDTRHNHAAALLRYLQSKG